MLLIKSKKPEEEVDNLNTAENGEASEKAHRASKLGLHRHLTQLQVVNTLTDLKFVATAATGGRVKFLSAV